MAKLTLALTLTAALGCRSSGSPPSTDPAAPVRAIPTASAVATAGAAEHAAAYAPYAERGTAAIDGQAFVLIRGGDVIMDTQGYLTTISDNVRTASGRPVTLDPATPYAMDWYMKNGMSLRRFNNAPSDSAFRAARRTTTADENGRFRFADLPAGRYIVRTTITWQVPRDSYRTMTQGGVASAVIDLTEAEQKTLIIRHVSEQP